MNKLPDAPRVHAWGDNDKPLCGGAMGRGDSLHNSVSRVTCADCRPAVTGWPRMKMVKNEMAVRIRSTRIDKFIDAVEKLCKEHGLALAPVGGLYSDNVGEFAVIKLGTPGTQWLETAAGEKLRNALVDGESFGTETP